MPDTTARDVDALELLLERIDALTETVGRLELEVAASRSDFAHQAERVELAIGWVVAQVREIRAGGVAGLLRGNKEARARARADTTDG